MRHDPAPRRSRPTRRSTTLLLLRLISRRWRSLRQLPLLLTRRLRLWWWGSILWRRWQHASVHKMRRRPGISKLRHRRLTWLLLLLSGLPLLLRTNTGIMLWRMRMGHRRALERRPTIRIRSTSLWRHPVHHGTLLSRHHRKLHWLTRLWLLRTPRTRNPIWLRWWWATGMYTHPCKIHRSWRHAWLELGLRRLLATHTRVHADSDSIRHRAINHIRVRRWSVLHILGHTVSQSAATHILLLLLLLSLLLRW